MSERHYFQEQLRIALQTVDLFEEPVYSPPPGGLISKGKVEKLFEMAKEKSCPSVIVVVYSSNNLRYADFSEPFEVIKHYEQIISFSLSSECNAQFVLCGIIPTPLCDEYSRQNFIVFGKDCLVAFLDFVFVTIGMTKAAPKCAVTRVIFIE